MECSFEGCERKMKARGLCNTHYEQQRRGLPLQPIVTVSNAGKVCSFPRCGRRVTARGLCTGHYWQSKNRAVLKPLRPRRKKLEAPSSCSFPGCSREAQCKGLCGSHYNQKRRTGSLKPLRPLGTPNEVIVCDEATCALILTNKRGQEKARAYIDRDQLECVQPYRWWCTRQGYVTTDLPNGKKLRLHRFLANPEKGMEVDHVDGDPLNNRLANLRVVTHAENSQNMKTSNASSTGQRNVQKINSGCYAGSFRVVVMKDGKQHYGGHFKNIEEAIAKAEELRASLFTHHSEQRT